CSVHCARYLHVFSSTDVHGVELTQPASMTVQPGQSLSINCKVSYSVTSYYTAFIRQPAGKALEWIGSIYSGATYYSDKLKNKFSLSCDTSTNTITIRGQNMQTEDTAVYYCAGDSQYHLYKLCHYVRVRSDEMYLTGCGCQTLTESEPVVIKPGGSHQLTCTYSGIDDSITSYYTAFIRQPAGKTLEWIGRIFSRGNYYSDKLKNKFSLSFDMSTNTITIQGQNMQTEDTAVYYCTRDSQ
ncbi:hypothetical protein C0J45_23674, partial [Silurus meridionalis]